MSIAPDETEDLKSRWPNWEMFVKRITVFLTMGIHEEELTRSEQKAIQKAAKTYYLEGGTLYHQRSKKPLRVVMQESEHIDVIRQFHVMDTGIHSGINATVDRITSKYFWRGIKQDVVQYISQCCGRHKDSTKPGKTQDDEPCPETGHSKTRSGTTAAQRDLPSVSSRTSLEESAMRLLEEYSLQLRSERTRGVSSLLPQDHDSPVQEDSAPPLIPRNDKVTTASDEVEGHSTAADHPRASEQALRTPSSATSSIKGVGFPRLTDTVGTTSTGTGRNKGNSDDAADFPNDGISDNMTASSTILKLISAASKEKSENQPTGVKPKSRQVRSGLPILPKPAAAAVKPQTPETDAAAPSVKRYRSFAWSLHNIGMRMVRQQVYKNLVEIQEVKDEQNRLDDGEKTQLEKLKGYYMDLRQKNRYLVGRRRRCRCGYRAGSLQELDLHLEYGHGSESGRHDCCLCKFTSKAFSLFSSHMAREHRRKARFHLPMAPFVCPYCQFEHRHNTKKKLLRHVANCERNFQLDCNLAVRAIDADIPLLAPPKSAVADTDASAAAPGSKAQNVANPSALRNQRSAKAGPDPACGGQPGSVGGPHSKMLHQPAHRYEVCEICGGFVRDRGSLIVHMKVAHKVDIHLACGNNSTAPVECGRCPERFWTLQSLNAHASASHDDAKETQNATISVCPLCKRTRLTDVMSHLAQQHRVTLLDMFLVRYCALCLLELHSEKSFEDHMTTYHSSLYPSRGALFESIGSLERQRMSNSSRPSALLLALVNRNKNTWKFGPSSSRNPLQMFSCPVCQCQFGGIDDLTGHFEQAHSHRCRRCEYRCGSAELLRRHFRKEHDGMERCPICQAEVAAGVATVAHFEQHHLVSCSVSLDRAATSDQMEVKGGVNVLTSGVKRRHPSSLSDGSNEDSVYDDDDEREDSATKLVRLETSNTGSGDV